MGTSTVAGGRPLDRLSVVHVIPGLGMGGGAERSWVEMGPALVDRGVELSFVVFRGGTDGEEILRSAGLEVEVVPGGRRAQVLGVRRVLRERRPHILHLTLLDANLAGRLASFGLPTTVVGSLVNLNYEASREDPSASRWQQLLIRSVDASTAHLFVDHHQAITGAAADAGIRALHLRPERITVVPRGRDPRRLPPRTEAARAEARRDLGIGASPVLLAVGRHDRQKNHVRLLEAMPAVFERVDDLVVLLAGRPGTASEEIAGTLRRLGLEDRVRILGYRQDVPALLAAADAFVFPSLWEGLGGAVLEAMAVGTPIAAGTIPAVLELVDEQCARLFDPRDPASLSSAVLGLLEDPVAAEVLAERARHRFLERFTLDAASDAMAAFYARVAAGAGYDWIPAAAPS